MNNHYVIIIFGWIIGQFAYAACSIYVLQKNKDVNYWKAAALYFSGEIGSFVLAFSGLLVLLFIIPDFFDVEITRKDLLNKEVLSWKEKFIVFQRSASIGVGAFIQHIIYAIFKKGKKKIEEYEIENKIASR
jgi:hypothetical protein